MGAESHKRGGSGSGQLAEKPAELPLRGVARLVNPPEDDLEAISGEEDQAERAY